MKYNIYKILLGIGCIPILLLLLVPHGTLYHNINNEYNLTLCICVSVFFAIVYIYTCIWAFDGNGKVVFFGTIFVLITYFPLTQLTSFYINEVFDSSDPQTRWVDVKRKLVRNPQFPSYEIYFIDPRSKIEKFIYTNDIIFDQTQIGNQTLRLTTREGYLGYEWVVMASPK